MHDLFHTFLFAQRYIYIVHFLHYLLCLFLFIHFSDYILILDICVCVLFLRKNRFITNTCMTFNYKSAVTCSNIYTREIKLAMLDSDFILVLENTIYFLIS